MRFKAYRVHAGIWSTASGNPFQFLNQIIHFFVIDDFCACGSCHFQTLMDAIDCYHPLRAEQERAADCKLADWATSPNRDHVTRLDLAIFRRHVSGRKNIRKKQHLLVVEAVRNFERANINKRHTRELCLSARITTHHVRITEKTRARIPVKLFHHPGIGVGVVACRPQLLLAEIALAARDRKGNDYAIAFFNSTDLGTGLDHLAHELMAQHIARL